jgi:hypothetical protein
MTSLAENTSFYIAYIGTMNIGSHTDLILINLKLWRSSPVRYLNLIGSAAGFKNNRTKLLTPTIAELA